jgi:hypothetical protein
MQPVVPVSLHISLDDRCTAGLEDPIVKHLFGKVPVGRVEEFSSEELDTCLHQVVGRDGRILMANLHSTIQQMGVDGIAKALRAAF